MFTYGPRHPHERLPLRHLASSDAAVRWIFPSASSVTPWFQTHGTRPPNIFLTRAAVRFISGVMATPGDVNIIRSTVTGFQKKTSRVFLVYSRYFHFRLPVTRRKSQSSYAVHKALSVFAGVSIVNCNRKLSSIEDRGPSDCFSNWDANHNRILGLWSGLSKSFNLLIGLAVWSWPTDRYQHAAGQGHMKLYTTYICRKRPRKSTYIATLLCLFTSTYYVNLALLSFI